MKDFFIGLVVVAFVTLSGCAGTEPSRLYILQSFGEQGLKHQIPETVKKVSILAGPVEIPDYLDRPQIVVRDNVNGLMLAEFDRWAGSLEEDIARVLVEDLSALLYPNTVSSMTGNLGSAFDYRIPVKVIRFDIVSDGYVLLKARWAVIGKDGKTVLSPRASEITEQVLAADYSSRVAAMSHALEKLSKDIADGMNMVFKER